GLQFFDIGAENRIERRGAGGDVVHRDADLSRPAIGLARHAHDAAHALRDDVEAAFLPVGAGLAEAGNRRIDDARVDFLDRLVVDAELFGDARPEILDDDVGRGGEFHKYFLALRLLHVERDALLVAIEHRKAIALVVDLGLEAARAVAFGKSFDLVTSAPMSASISVQ